MRGLYIYIMASSGQSPLLKQGHAHQPKHISQTASPICLRCLPFVLSGARVGLCKPSPSPLLVFLDPNPDLGSLKAVSSPQLTQTPSAGSWPWKVWLNKSHLTLANLAQPFPSS